MRKTMATCAAALLLCVAPVTTAWSASESAIDRQVRSAATNTDKGRDQLDRVVAADSTSDRLYRLDRALVFLRRSRSATEKQPETEAVARVRSENDRLMVRALVDEAEIYLGRRSLSLAGKRIEEARSIDPTDGRVRVVGDMILQAKSTDPYTEYTNTVAMRRILDRRAVSVGVPIRDRSLGRFR